MSTYCVEHELLVRALKESERAQVAAHDEIADAADAALTADTALTAAAPESAAT